MKNLYLCFAFSFFILNANAQKNCSIVSSKAYATTIFHGMVMVDNDGNEIPQSNTYNRKIFITTTCNKAPIINSIVYNKAKAKSKVKPVTEKNIEIGNDNTGKKIILKVSKTNFLWEVEIDLGENSITTEKVKSIIINGINNNKTFKLILKEINIVPLIMPV